MMLVVTSQSKSIRVACKGYDYKMANDKAKKKDEVRVRILRTIWMM